MGAGCSSCGGAAAGVSAVAQPGSPALPTPTPVAEKVDAVNVKSALDNEILNLATEPVPRSESYEEFRRSIEGSVKSSQRDSEVVRSWKSDYSAENGCTSIMEAMGEEAVTDW